MVEVVDFKRIPRWRVKILSGPFFINYAEGKDGKAVQTGFLTYSDWEGGDVPSVYKSPALSMANAVFTDQRERDAKKLRRQNIYLELPLNP